MPVVGAFVLIVLVMAAIAGLSMLGDRKRREHAPPPIPRPIPPGTPTGIHLRWGVHPTPPRPRGPAGGVVGEDVVPVDGSVIAGLRAEHRNREIIELVRGMIDRAAAAGQTPHALYLVLAGALLAVGEYHEGEDVARRGLDEGITPAQRGGLLAMQGMAACSLGELERARLLLEAAAEVTAPGTAMSIVELNLGVCEREAGRPEVARGLFHAGLDGLGSETEADTVRTFLHVYLSSLDAAAGDLAAARRELDAARAVECTDVAARADLELHTATVLRLGGDAAQAVSTTRRAREVFARLDLPPNMAEADVELGRGLAAMGEHDDARAAYWAAIWAYDGFGCHQEVQQLRAEVATAGP